MHSVSFIQYLRIDIFKREGLMEDHL